MADQSRSCGVANGVSGDFTRNPTLASLSVLAEALDIDGALFRAGCLMQADGHWDRSSGTSHLGRQNDSQLPTAGLFEERS